MHAHHQKEVTVEPNTTELLTVFGDMPSVHEDIIVHDYGRLAKVH